MAERFVVLPPGTQNPDTYRQFQRLAQYLELMELRLAPLFGSASITPVVLDPVVWSELVLFDSNLPDVVSAYNMGMRLAISGSTANAWVQLRVTWDYDGGGEVIGSQVDIGNNTLESVTLTGTAIAGIGIKFWARGDSSEILSGRVTISRIGIGP